MFESLDKAFSERTKDISSIFSSYRDLYQIYLSTLRLSANKNTTQAFERAKETVEVRQKEISGQLYSQGFILLTGAAEALLKDLFESLLRENFSQINVPPSINFSVKEIQDSFNDRGNKEADQSILARNLGDLTVRKLTSGKNPIEKINFQNVQSTKEIFDQYFAIKLTESDYLRQIHRYWQVRHVLIHNNAHIDSRFMHNVNVVGLLQESEKLNSSIVVTKRIFDEANEDFHKFFNELDQLVEATNLNCSLLNKA